MLTTHHPRSNAATAKATFTSASVTVGSLYLATHSVVVTLIGTTAATSLTSLVIWLSHTHKRDTGETEHSSAQNRTTNADHGPLACAETTDLVGRWDYHDGGFQAFAVDQGSKDLEHSGIGRCCSRIVSTLHGAGTVWHIFEISEIEMSRLTCNDSCSGSKSDQFERRS